jgi:hypothetical protein
MKVVPPFIVVNLKSALDVTRLVPLWMKFTPADGKNFNAAVSS